MMLFLFYAFFLFVCFAVKINFTVFGIEHLRQALFHLKLVKTISL